jgi:hypothetical protein
LVREGVPWPWDARFVNDLQPPIHDYDAYAAAWNRPPASQKLSTFDIVVMSICGVIGASALMLAGVIGFFTIVFMLSDDPSSDPHGYGVVFGFLIGVPSALLAALVLPGAFPPGMRARAFGVSMALLAIVAVGFVLLMRLTG